MRGNNPLTQLCTLIVKKRKIVFAVFIVVCLFCAVSRNWVQVNDSLTAYLSEDTETRIALDLMDTEFIEYGTADVMVQNITYVEAEKLEEDIENIEGVKSVAFDDTTDHFTGADALFTITFEGSKDDQVSIDSLASVEEFLSDYDTYVNTEVGNPLKAIINREMVIVDLIAVIIIILVLLLTSKTFAEIPVLLMTFGAAALLNMGTNFLMGEISFVTNSIAIVLQLALAIDYAIILCHRYMEEHEKLAPEEAAIVALSKAIPEISASSLTTVSGLLALCFMQYGLGPDIGKVMIKAILLSLLSVFLLMPGLLVMFSKLIDNTHHKNFVPPISGVGRLAYKTRFIIPPLFVVLLAFACFCSNNSHYVYNQYSISSIRQNDTQIAKKTIEDTFGKKNVVAIIVPYGDFDSEKALVTDLKTLDYVTSVTALSDIEAMDGYMLTDSVVPREFSEILDLDVEIARIIYTGYASNEDEYEKAIANLDGYSVPLIDMFDYLLEMKDDLDLDLPEETIDDLNDLQEQLNDGKAQLMSENWARIVLYLNLPVETDESFEAMDTIHEMAAKYYETYYVAGDTTSCIDLKDSFEHDNILISILTIVFVIAVLILTFKSIALPVLLIMTIQGSIWINFSVPYVRGANVFFLTYLIISAIQMGANIDYAIVISSRYTELKKEFPIRDAMIMSLNQAFPTIITSGTMLASAGFAIGFVTSNETISAIGVYLCEGTLISMALVLFVLPQTLLFGDYIIRKTSFELGGGVKTTQKVGTIRVDGKVKGQFTGYIDAEVHGIFKGDLNAVIDMAHVTDVNTGAGSAMDALTDNSQTGGSQTGGSGNGTSAADGTAAETPARDDSKTTGRSLRAGAFPMKGKSPVDNPDDFAEGDDVSTTDETIPEGDSTDPDGSPADPGSDPAWEDDDSNENHEISEEDSENDSETDSDEEDLTGEDLAEDSDNHESRNSKKPLTAFEELMQEEKKISIPGLKALKNKIAGARAARANAASKEESSKKNSKETDSAEDARGTKPQASGDPDDEIMVDLTEEEKDHE